MLSCAHFIIATLFVLLLSACSDVGYYVQCARGHIDLMARSRPIETVLADPKVTETERLQLAKALQIRSYASSELALPDNGSYRKYANIGRPYVVWNVVAAPELSLEPKQWCFLIAGCVTYRGYFDQRDAELMAEELQNQGYEVDVYGVQAYSTLNWFDDPVLNTFLNGESNRLAALIFHELAHQKVYVPGDSAFNEAFAKTVELEGLRRWMETHGGESDWQIYEQRRAQQDAFQTFLAQVRTKLNDLYIQAIPDDEKRFAKRQILERAQQDYQLLRGQWVVADAYDQWMSGGLNNARLASVATYHDLVPDFQALLALYQGDLEVFYAEVEELGKLPPEQRLAKLKDLGRKSLLANQKVIPDGLYGR